MSLPGCVNEALPGPLSTPVLEGRGLHRTYRLGATRVPAVADISLVLSPGEFLVLQGPSGSGKTTLINLLGLLDRPDDGLVLVEGRPVDRLDEDRRSDLRRDRFGYIFQTFNLIPVLTAAENVAYPMILRGASAQEQARRSRQLLASVGLANKADVRPDLLSGGERQRVAVARALVNDPAVMLADEPTANLDSRTADGVLDLLEELRRDLELAIVVATHDPRVVARADRVIALRDGRVEEPA